jgi:diguanylate cyclase (GGDEF)-like protein
MPREINRAKREQKQLAFIMLDIDFFKRYNDTYGHANGDEVLIRVAHTVQHYFSRASDFCFRLGGEEFGIICSVNTYQDTYNQVEQLRNAIEELKIEHKENDASPFVTVSIGITFSDGSETMDVLYSAVDAELYNAKESGRNCIYPLNILQEH